ncbi:WXG100 family type VII secretion target [Micromonospora sp. HNM0581]|uniref:WXG100 family type VII secretion target n=1 Tax=Micromonospora sp. HNM0581 TaxID=2716341 RepID=UPI00146D60D9|nr:WXG100 family type VII secretion target [Micromonospora sp. HNM0581]NLU79858.1 WXG100 family type VII secretion target [Micromonospora sp. HNM0581]
MTMPQVQTTEEGMRRAAQEFSDKATEFTGSLQAVNGQMGVLQASWTGQASANFNQAMDSWEAAFGKVINELVTMLDVMGVTTTGYRDAEDTAASTASSFGSALPGV